MGDVIKSLEDYCVILFEWFLDNQMKANSNEFHFIANKQTNKQINKQTCMNLKTNKNIEKL